VIMLGFARASMSSVNIEAEKQKIKEAARA
jgi:hypothetical protein